MDSVHSVIWRDVVKTLLGFALGTLLSLGTVTSAGAAGTNVAAPVQVPDAGIEVIVVTAKRLPVPSVAVAVAVAQPIDEFIVIAKRAAAAPERTPPVMAIEMPKVEFAVARPAVIRL
jgi:hypothetical protein